MRDGAISACVAHRELNVPFDNDPVSTVWVRSFELGGRHLAFVQASAAAQGPDTPISRHLGREPATMAIGTIDEDFTITALSSDITDLVGLSPHDLVGTMLLTPIAQRDVTRLLAATDGGPERAVALTIHLRDDEGQWAQLFCVLASLAGTPDRCFILTPEPDAGLPRIAELEHHLWSIAAIVDASGVLQGVEPSGNLTWVPEANDLTTRQWEILSRLVRGARVATIADDLHVSPSTVRNHLSSIFRRFGVHSQAELLGRIAGKPVLPAHDGTGV
jgi:DNA-binding CsgD family transcriptional regulator